MPPSQKMHIRLITGVSVWVNYMSPRWTPVPSITLIKNMADNRMWKNGSTIKWKLIYKLSILDSHSIQPASGKVMAACLCLTIWSLSPDVSMLGLFRLQYGEVCVKILWTVVLAYIFTVAHSHKSLTKVVEEEKNKNSIYHLVYKLIHIILWQLRQREVD